MQPVEMYLIKNQCLRDELETIVVVYVLAIESLYFFSFFLLVIAISPVLFVD
jgi:hypothetical protein